MATKRSSAQRDVPTTVALKLLCSRLDDLLDGDAGAADGPTDGDADGTGGNTDVAKEAKEDDVYHRFLSASSPSRGGLGRAGSDATHRHSNLSAGHSMHAKMQGFIKAARKEMGMDRFGSGILDVEDGASEMDGRYLVWLCDLLFDGTTHTKDGDELGNAIHAWQTATLSLLGGEQIMWRLLLQNVNLDASKVTQAVNGHLKKYESGRLAEYGIEACFAWPSFLHGLVKEHNPDGGGKRRKSSHGFWKKPKLLEQGDTEWLPLLGYLITFAFLSHNEEDRDGDGLDNINKGGPTIHERLDHLQSILPSLPTTLGINPLSRKEFMAGMAACLIDGLGEGLVRGMLSLEDEQSEFDGLQQSEDGCSLLGAEVGQIVALLGVPGLLSTLAESVACPLSGIVSETASTLLDYSDVNHRLHHQSPIGSAGDEEVIRQLMALDAIHVMQFIDKADVQLRRELSDKKFTSQTFNEDDPRKHPIVTYLRARLVSGNLDEGSKLCRQLEQCSGLNKETERCCWYSLFDKMQEESVLFEHDWDRNRSGFVVVPFMDHRGTISKKKVGNVTLANIMIGPFGRMVVLEYLSSIVTMAKEELFPGYNALKGRSIRSKHSADIDKQQLLAVKDAVRRTVIKFLVPRPHSPPEVLMIANSVSEADKPPLLKYSGGPTRGENAAQLCCRILSEGSLLMAWEERELELEAEELEAQEEETGPMVPQEDSVQDDGGVMDMSMEIIPPTPAKTPMKPPAAATPKAVKMQPPAKHEEIVLGDSDDEQEKHVSSDVEPEEHAEEEVYQEDEINAEEHEEEVQCEEEADEVQAEQEQHPDDSMTKSLGSSDDDQVEEEEGYYDSNEEYTEENVETRYPPHYQHQPGNYSESDDYDKEDAEEEDRRAAFEGEYDDEEGRGSSRSDGSVEVIDILSSDEEEEEEEVDFRADVAENESSAEELQDETAVLNAVVDDYIDAVPNEQPLAEAAIDEAKILHDSVKEYIPVSSPHKKSPKKKAEEAVDTTEGKVPAEDEVPPAAKDSLLESKEMEVEPPVEVGEHLAITDALQPAMTDVEPPVVDVEHPSTEAVHGEGKIDEGTAQESKPIDHQVCLEEVETVPTGEEAKEEVVIRLESKPTEDEAEKSDAPYSSDGGNLGGELSEDMNADDEHESLDTEDDKRSLAEQGETFDEEEGASEHVSPSQEDENGDEELDEMEIDQPSILVAAAMSSQQQGSSFQDVMAKSYRRASIRSYDNTDQALAATDANLSEYYQASQDGASSLVVEANVQVLAQRRGQDLASTSVLEEHIDVIDSDVEGHEGGQLTDDGYQPDAEVTEEEKVERKKTRTIDDGYVPDAEATEEENTKPLERVGPKAVKKRDVRFEAVLETRKKESSPPAPPIELAANQSIDDGYLPDGALTEEEKRDREERRSRNVEEGYLPDGHTTATDDDTAEKKERRSAHRRVAPAPAAEVEDTIDPGYLPSAVEGTEEERSEEESQDAETIASVLVATALVTQKGASEVGCIAKKASLATARIAKPKSLSTQSIDDGYLPDGFTEEERGDRRGRERRRHDVEEGYLPDGHTTPGEATEEDQPDPTNNKPHLLRDVGLKLSTPESAIRNIHPDIPADSSIDLATVASGYLPSEAAEEERSEEEDIHTLTDVKVGTNIHGPDGPLHDTEEESLAMASSAEVTEKQATENKETGTTTKDEVVDAEMDEADSPKASTTDSKVEETKSSGDIALQNTPSSRSPTAEKGATTNVEPNSNSNQPRSEDNLLLSPITANPLNFLPVSSQSEATKEKDATKKPPPKGDEPQKDSNEHEETLEALKSVQKSPRKTKSKPESDIEQADDKSVPSETSSTRRSTRLRGKKSTASPKVPTSITTGRRGKKAPALPAVPENENLNNVEIQEPAETEAAVAHSIASRTRRRGKRGTNEDDDASVASTVGEETGSIASRSRRRGKRSAKDDDDASHISAEDEVSSRGTRSKRAKSVDTDAASEEKKTASSKRRGGRGKQVPSKVEIGEQDEIHDDVSESVPSPPPRKRRGAKKDDAKDNSEDKVDASESIPSQRLKKGRGGRKTKVDAVGDETKDNQEETEENVSESVPSPSPKRKGRAKKKVEAADDETKDDASEPVASPKARNTRRKKTATQSEGSVSIASSRPRRNTRSSKKYDA